MNDAPPIRSGTRGSDLALWQANTVKDLLSREAPMREVEIVTVKTLGDRVQDKKIEEIGRTAVFTAELDRALQESAVDIAVHSLKDVETLAVPGIELAAVLPRGPVEDALVGPRSLEAIPAGARVGTGSVRRIAQLLRARPDLKPAPIRGNVPTRLEKLDRGEYDALLMARAGLVRLGLGHRITCVLPPDLFMPAVGQGAIAITCRSDDEAVRRLLAGLNHEPTWRMIRAERACLNRLGGGCNLPLGVFGTLTESSLRIAGRVLSVDGKDAVDAEVVRATSDDPAAAGRSLAEALLARGAGRILDALLRGKGTA